MKGLPAELVFALIFVGMWLVQTLLKRRRGQEPLQPSQEAGVAQPPEEAYPELAELEEEGSIAWGPSRASVHQVVPPEASAASRTRPRRRFSRQSLMGTRRDVQNAVVIATILGPCRAVEPPG
jgi:hypothetical protein